MNWTINLKLNSRTPKYQQLFDSLAAGIECGGIRGGDRLPSINELSEQYLLSKETVERAYHELNDRGLVTSVARRGYFVSDGSASRAAKVLLLVGDVTEGNQHLYRSILAAAGRNVKIDVFTYGYRSDTCRRLLDNFAGHYQHIVLVPHLLDETDELASTLRGLTGINLIVLGQKLHSLSESSYSSVTINIRQEFYDHLTGCLPELLRYEALNFIVPENEYVDTAYLTVFRAFGDQHGLNYHLIDSLADETVQPNQLYITADNTDLVETIRQAARQQLIVGQDLGLISLNDSSLHELLVGGVSAFSGQTEQMGQLVGALLKERGRRASVHQYQPLRFIRRATF